MRVVVHSEQELLELTKEMPPCIISYGTSRNGNDMQIFNNVRFYKSKKERYFLGCINRKRKRMHVYVWEFYNGAIPLKHHIHHKDDNPVNNAISNLEILFGKDHSSMHAKRRVKNNPAFYKEFSATGIKRVKEWRESQQGQIQQKNHGKWLGKMAQANKEEKVCKCLHCGKETTYRNMGGKKYCNDKCKFKYRHERAPIYEKKCVGCGRLYKTKYKDGVNCSTTCHKKKHK